VAVVVVVAVTTVVLALKTFTPEMTLAMVAVLKEKRISI
jgi:hypothetical protein